MNTFTVSELRVYKAFHLDLKSEVNKTRRPLTHFILYEVHITHQQHILNCVVMPWHEQSATQFTATRLFMVREYSH